MPNILHMVIIWWIIDFVSGQTLFKWDVMCSLFVGVDCMAKKWNFNESYISLNEKPAFLQ